MYYRKGNKLIALQLMIIIVYEEDKILVHTCTHRVYIAFPSCKILKCFSNLAKLEFIVPVSVANGGAQSLYVYSQMSISFPHAFIMNTTTTSFIYMAINR